MMKTIILLFFAIIVKFAEITDARNLPFKLGIRDSIMIAHSFHENPSFGPAGKMHGATYTCDVEFSCEDLVPELNWVMDIGKASDLLAEVLSRYNLKNLDEVFPSGELTTTEFMARKIHQDLAELIQNEMQETCNDDNAECEAMWEGEIRVKLWESHKAWASYEAEIA